MKVLVVLFGILVCGASNALNITHDARYDHRSLDLVLRHLDNMDYPDNKDLKLCILHIKPILERHGGPVKEGTHTYIELYSQEEVEVILTQHHKGSKNVSLDDVLALTHDATTGRLWKWLKMVFWVSLPWVGFGFLLWFFVIRPIWQRKDRAFEAMDRRAETLVPDRTERRRVFDDPDIAREHARVKKKMG